MLWQKFSSRLQRNSWPSHAPFRVLTKLCTRAIVSRWTIRSPNLLVLRENCSLGRPMKLCWFSPGCSSTFSTLSTPLAFARYNAATVDIPDIWCRHRCIQSLSNQRQVLAEIPTICREYPDTSHSSLVKPFPVIVESTKSRNCPSSLCCWILRLAWADKRILDIPRGRPVRGPWKRLRSASVERRNPPKSPLHRLNILSSIAEKSLFPGGIPEHPQHSDCYSLCWV